VRGFQLIFQSQTNEINKEKIVIKLPTNRIVATINLENQPQANSSTSQQSIKCGMQQVQQIETIEINGFYSYYRTLGENTIT